METDEAAEAFTVEGNVPEAMVIALEPIVGDDALATWHFTLFFGALLVF